MDTKTRIEIKEEMNAMEKHVAEWINEMAEDYEDGAEGVLKDLMHGGCQSGFVNHLIYHTDCNAFFMEYADEIQDMCEDWQESVGEHPLAANKDRHGFSAQPMLTFLAWFSFEETAHRLGMDNGIEISCHPITIQFH